MLDQFAYEMRGTPKFGVTRVANPAYFCSDEWMKAFLPGWSCT